MVVMGNESSTHTCRRWSPTSFEWSTKPLGLLALSWACLQAAAAVPVGHIVPWLSSEMGGDDAARRLVLEYTKRMKLLPSSSEGKSTVLGGVHN